MGSPTETRPLTSGIYLTDGDRQLVLVLDLPEPGQAVVEDARTGTVSCIAAEGLDGWRVVEPAGDGT